jgi:hypothetical protein
MPALATKPKWIRRCPQRGHGIGVALDVYTKSSMKDQVTAAKQLEDSILTKAIRARKRSA